MTTHLEAIVQGSLNKVYILYDYVHNYAVYVSQLNDEVLHTCWSVNQLLVRGIWTTGRIQARR